MLPSRQSEARFITANKENRLVLALGIGTLAVLVGLLAAKRISYAVLVVGIVAGPILFKLLGISPFLISYAALSWSWNSINYLFLSSNLLVSASVPEVGIYFLLLIFVFGPSANIKSRWRALFSTPLLLPLAGFVAGATVAFLIGPDARNPENFAYLRYAAFYGPAIYLLITNTLQKQRDAVYILMALVIGGTLFGATLSFNIGGYWDLVARIEGGRALGYYLNNIESTGFVQIATYLSILLPVAVALALNSQQLWLGSLFVAISAALGVMLASSEGRGGWLGAITSVLVVMFLSTIRQRNLSWRVVTTGILVGAIVAAVVSRGVLNPAFYDRAGTLLSFQTESSFTGRLVIWQSAWQMLGDYPLGVGFPYFLHRFGLTAHNEFLQLGLGGGFLGLFSFLAFLVGVVRACWYGLRHSGRDIQTICIAALGCCVSLVVNGMGDNPSTNSAWSWQVIWIVLAIAVGGLRAAAKEQHLEEDR